MLTNQHLQSINCKNKQLILGLNIDNREEYLSAFPNAEFVSEESKKAYSEWQIGKSYEDKGYSEEEIDRIKKAQGDASIKFRKGKTNEELYGKETADRMKQAHAFMKGKTYEEMYGEEKANEIKKAKSLAMTGHSQTTETRNKIRDKQLGVTKPRYISKEELHRIMSKANKGKKSWSKRLKKIDHVGIMKIAVATQKHWDSLTLEEKHIQLKKMNKAPNKDEQKLIPILLKYGFMYVGNHKFFIERHNPDFLNPETKTIIEYDGDGAHNPNLPWVPKDQPEKDKIRNEIYMKNGYKVVILRLEDIKDQNLIDLKLKSVSFM